MGIEFKDIDNTENILRMFKALDYTEIRVGFFGGEGKKAQLPMIAQANEFGTSNGRIPERAFMRKTFDDDNAIRECFEFGIEIYNKTGTIENLIKAIAQKLVAKVQASIDSNIPPPNAPSTIKAKGGKDHTLIDTGRMRQGVVSKLVIGSGDAD